MLSQLFFPELFTFRIFAIDRHWCPANALLVDYLVDLQIFFVVRKCRAEKIVKKHPNELVALVASSSASLWRTVHGFIFQSADVEGSCCVGTAR